MRRGRFDIEEYLIQLQFSKYEKKSKKHTTPSFSKTRHCIYSKDPVKDDLIWRSVVLGETAAAQRRKRDYASTNTLIERSTSSRSRNSSLQFSAGGEGQDTFLQRLLQSYAHAAHGPPLPPTSNGYIGWRSSVPDLRLERYGPYT
ncbi:uncharacterized protein [Cherax quadricarinatus]|nr:uncharacterized protein LOC128700503 [Cherax quadricarinatus]